MVLAWIDGRPGDRARGSRTGIRPRRHGRGRLAAPLLAMPLLLSGAAACSSDGRTETGGKALTFATYVEPDCLDPQVSALDVTSLVDRSIFDSLVAMTSDGKFHPWLAERWTVSPDRKTYTFHLKAGVEFHDRTPLDAAAVKATLDRTVDPKTKSRYAASLLRAYKASEVVDASTVKVDLHRPDSSFLYAVSTAFLGIQSPASVKADPAGPCSKPVGSGPFQFTSWTRNKNIVLSKNARYDWGPGYASRTGPAVLDKLTIDFVSENSVRLGMLTSGQADVVDNVPVANAKTVEASGRNKLLRAKVPGAVFGIFLNSTHGVLSDERVRKALVRSIDLDKLVQSVYFGQYDRAWSLLSPSTLGYAPSTEGSWPHDPVLSGKLLDEAGWTGRDDQGYRTKDGERLKLRWPYVELLMRDGRDLLAQGVQAAAKQIGIEVQLIGEDGGALGRELLAETPTLDLFGNSFGSAEPDILRYYFAADRTPPKGGGNFFHLTEGPLDGWLRDAVSTGNAAERTRIYADVQTYLVEHSLVIPTYVPVRLVGTAENVSGVRFDANAYPLFYEAGPGNAS